MVRATESKIICIHGSLIFIDVMVSAE